MDALRRLRDRALARMEPVVFLGSAATVVAFVALGALATEPAARAFSALQAGARSRGVPPRRQLRRDSSRRQRTER